MMGVELTSSVLSDWAEVSIRWAIALAPPPAEMFW